MSEYWRTGCPRRNGFMEISAEYGKVDLCCLNVERIPNVFHPSFENFMGVIRMRITENMVILMKAI